MSRHVAIVGTAETWREAPFHDESVEIWTLNDAYMLGFPRIDVHFEMHPLDKLFFRNPKEKVSITDVPFGHYVRPEGHLEWLAKFSQEHDLWLQGEPPKGWKHAKMFPRQELVDAYQEVLFPDPSWRKEYIASGPSWMLMLAIHQNVDEISIHGIHLATDREYVDQRPNFEYLLGYAKGLGVKIHLPMGTPICKAPNVYCYEPRLSVERDRVAVMLHERDRQYSSLVQKVMNVPRWRSGRIREQMAKLDVERAELRHQLSAIDFKVALERPEWRV